MDKPEQSLSAAARAVMVGTSLLDGDVLNLMRYIRHLEDSEQWLRRVLIDICTSLDTDGRIAPGALEAARMLIYPAGDCVRQPRPRHGMAASWKARAKLYRSLYRQAMDLYEQAKMLYAKSV